MKPITTAFIQIDVGGCQQPEGWFDQLDPQWNVTLCMLDKVYYNNNIIIILLIARSLHSDAL